MIVKLARHNLKSDPNWEVINSIVPLGTEYEVIAFESECNLHNIETNKTITLSVFYVIGNGGQGYLPTEIFEAVDISEES